MKLTILQWVDPIDNRGMGTIERISTTGRDCVNYFHRQMKALGCISFVASESGQLEIEHPEYRDEYDRFIETYDELRKYVQNRLDSDSLGQIYIRGEHIYPDGEVEHKWWKIQFRNLH